ncbi:amino acid adenylation domain-containing protein [Pseudomonas sp. CrR25]|nr:amino acid adenylation domain-containing protein [Pseudomonas sp. CrR25]
MRALLKAIGQVGLQVVVKDESTPMDAAEGASEVKVSRNALQVRDLLRGRLPLETPVPGMLATGSYTGDAFPLSDIQYAYLIGRNPGLELGGVASCLYFELDMVKPDLAALSVALNEVVAFHPMLRAIVTEGGRQRVLPEGAPYPIAVQDGRAWDESLKHERLQAIRQEMERSLRPIDQAPSFDIRATQISDDVVRLHLYFDLMFVDIHSVRIVLKDWWRCYRQRGLDTSSSAPAFAAYLEAERSLQGQLQGQRDKQYWEYQLDNLPPAPELPLQCSPELLARPVFKRSTRTISAGIIDGLRQVARARGLTLETVFLGAYAETLRQWSKRQSFTMTLTQLGRRAHFAGIENVVGNFLQPALLAVNSTAESTFGERLAQLQTDLIVNRWHSSYSGIQVLRELTRRSHEGRAVSAPIVFSNTLTADLRDVVADIGWDEATQVYSSHQTPQVWLENQIVRVDGVLCINWNQVEGLFPEGMVDAMLDSYERLIVACATDAAVWNSVGSVVPLPSADLLERLQANHTDADVGPRLLHELVLESAARYPQAVAIVQGPRQITYGELAADAARVARRILDRAGVGPGDIVAVSLPQGPELIVAILAVLMSGAAYVAIDPSLPEQRRRSLLQRCSAKAIVTDASVFPDTDGLSQLPRIDVADRRTDAAVTEPLPSRQGLDDLAYVIFTSGSTGEPKGVMVSHRNAANTILDINRRFQVTRDDAVFSVAPAGFDLSVYDYFGLLGAGGRIVFQSRESANDPRVWAEELAANGVTIWNSVPAPVKALVDRCGPELAGTRLRLILMSGDWIPVDLPARIREVLAEVAIISLGGATEGSIWSICYPIEEVDRQWSSIPYGKPLANQRFHVLNDWLAPSPKWVIGELYIAGEGVTQGYLGDPEKTAQRFITHPVSGERLYRTGDLGRYTADGLIEILGREDSQVKINGYRVELGEVEACLLAHDSASHVVIAAPTHGKTGQRHLVAYVVPSEAYATLEHAALQERLQEAARRTLPSYMIPSYYVVLSHMPLTSNGKIDRQALPLPWADVGNEPAGAVEPANETEALLLSIWREQLQHEDFDVTDGFFDIGGDSFHAVGLLSAIRQAFSVTPSSEQDMIEGLFMNANIQALARIIGTPVKPVVGSPA